MLHKYFLYVCESNRQVVVYGFLYGYKGLLHVTALIVAFGTRKVKVEGMNDSKYIAAAVYITSIVLAVATVSTYTLMDYVNVYPAVVGLGFLLGTTVILGLVFLPRVSMYIKTYTPTYNNHECFPCRWWVYIKIQMERISHSILLLERIKAKLQVKPVEVIQKLEDCK